MQVLSEMTRSWLINANLPDSEKANAFLPLGISSLSVSSSPSAHVFAVLDSAKEADEKGLNQGLYGKDVMVWGGNGMSSPIYPPLMTNTSSGLSAR
jgi:hypothetical protein